MQIAKKNCNQKKTSGQPDDAHTTEKEHMEIRADSYSLVSCCVIIISSKQLVSFVLRKDTFVTQDSCVFLFWLLI